MSIGIENMMLPLPARIDSRTDSFREFDKVGNALIKEWLERKKLKGVLPPGESASGYLKRECYRIIIHYMAKGPASFFEQVVRRDGRALTSRVKLEENPFHYGLLALFDGEDVVSRQDRSTFASQMLYAYHHSVPPKFLIGFIYQAGSKDEIRRKLAKGEIEPGFESVYKANIRDVRVVPLR